VGGISVVDPDAGVLQMGPRGRRIAVDRRHSFAVSGRATKALSVAVAGHVGTAACLPTTRALTAPANCSPFLLGRELLSLGHRPLSFGYRLLPSVADCWSRFRPSVATNRALSTYRND